MLSLGIIWNKAYEYKREIISDIEGRVKLLECFDLDLNDDYEGFVKEIYQNENMEDWKIDRKINAMCPCDSKKISVVIFEFDSSRVVYHEFKHKDVYEELESLKMYIREKYSKLVDNYVFDIIFHSTDNYSELRGCLETIRRYEGNIIGEEEPIQRCKKILPREKNIGER